MDRYAIDSHSLFFHPRRAADWLDGALQWETAKHVYPLYVEISPFGGCNHRCSFCALDYLGYAPQALDSEIMARRLAEMGALGVRSVMFAGEGEPLLAKGLAHQTRAAKAAGMDVSFTTNAVLLTRERAAALLPHAAWCKASVNAGTPETYAAIHGASSNDFNRVVENLTHAVRAREVHGWDCTIGVQMLLLPENIAEAETLAHICRDAIGADYLVVKPHSQHPFTKSTRYANLTPTDLPGAQEVEAMAERLSTDSFQVIYRGQAMRRAEEQKPYDNCGATPFLWAYVASSGDVYSCSAFLGDPRFNLGNLQTSSFQAIWEGEGRRRNWEFLQSGLDIGECRANCRMDAINRYLWRLRHPHAHDAFI